MTRIKGTDAQLHVNGHVVPMATLGQALIRATAPVYRMKKAIERATASVVAWTATFRLSPVFRVKTGRGGRRKRRRR